MIVIRRRLTLERLQTRQLMAADSLPGFGSSDTHAVNDIDPQSIRAAEVRIQFDPEQVIPKPEDFMPGSAWNGKGAIITKVDPSEGTVTAFLFSIDPVNVSQGSLIDMPWQIDVSPDHPATPVIAIESITVDEGQQVVDPHEHRIDTVASELIKQQLLSRESTEIVVATHDQVLTEWKAGTLPVNPVASTPFVSPETEYASVLAETVYGPIPPWLLEDHLAAEILIEKDDERSADAAIQSPVIESSERMPDDVPGQPISRSLLLAGARDDWSELDRRGHRKA